MTDDFAKKALEATAEPFRRMRDVLDARSYDNIPPLVMEAMKRYAKEGSGVGDFLQAVIGNDFMDAIGRADDYSIRVLPAIASYIYMEFPAKSHGSRQVYRAWLALNKAKRDEATPELQRRLRTELDTANKEATEWKKKP
jgi:hypothetical protein